MFKRNTRKKTAFTLLEVIFAISLILIGIIGALIAIQQITSSVKIVSSQLIASYLCQEGVEIVRNIRDGNWLNERNWTYGIFCCGGASSCECEADYNDLIITRVFVPPGNPLKIGGGFYNYEAGTSTPFIRKITVASTTADRIDISVLVSWRVGGREYQASTTEYLYNWR